MLQSKRRLPFMLPDGLAPIAYAFIISIHASNWPLLRTANAVRPMLNLAKIETQVKVRQLGPVQSCSPSLSSITACLFARIRYKNTAEWTFKTANLRALANYFAHPVVTTIANKWLGETFSFSSPDRTRECVYTYSCATVCTCPGGLLIATTRVKAKSRH